MRSITDDLVLLDMYDYTLIESILYCNDQLDLCQLWRARMLLVRS